MPARRPSRSGPVPAEAAARRLALLAADLGAPAAGSAAAPAARPAPRSAATAERDWWADHTRVAGPPAAPGPVPVATAASAASVASAAEETLPAAAPDRADGPGPSVAAPALPHPGRHAARRRRRLWLPGRDLSGLRSGVPGLAPAHVTVVAVLVAAGLAVTAWWVARDRPEQLVPAASQPAPPLVGSSPSGAGQPPGEAGEEARAAGAEGSVTVDVAGKVRRPGIVVLDAGSRVADALEAAGGPRRGVDLSSLNLARVLVDGEQVLVGVPGVAAPAPAPGDGASGPAAPGSLVNLNLATQAELEALPQVGPVTAQAIITWREQHGGFTSVEELLEVDGIGEKTLAQLTPHVTV